MSKDTKPDGGLTIASVDIRNFKRIQCVKFSPKPTGLTEISGKNRAGKTSAINAIQMGFSGGKYRPTDLHNDQGGPGDYAEVNIVTTNNYKVRIYGKNGTIEVTDPSGNTGGIKLFGDAVSSFAIDLRPFINANATEKYKIAIEAMGIGDMLGKIEIDRKAKYELRGVANAVLKKATAVLDTTFEPAEDVKVQDEVDVVAVAKQIQAATEHNTERDQLVNEKNAIPHAILELEKEHQKLLGEAELVTEDIEEKKRELKNFGRIPDLIEINAMQATLAASQETNKTRTAALKLQETYDNALKARQDADKDATTAQKALDEVLEKKNNIVTELGAFPDPNITMEDGKLLYKGREWDCVSGAEEYIVATQIGIATNKGCNFVLSDGLERMDEDERAKYGAWGEQEGHQLIGTVVTSDPDQCTVYIVDGMVKEE